MTLQEMDAPALIEERRDEPPPSQPRAAPDPEAWPSRRGASSPRSIDCGFGGGRELRSPEVGRLLRREGLYRSDGMAQGAASLQGLTPSKRGRKPAERNPLEGARARGVAPGEGAAHRPYDPGRPGKLPYQPRTREGLLMAVQPLASQVGVAPACRALGVQGFLAASEARSRASAAPSYPARALCPNAYRTSSGRQPALRRPVTAESSRRCLMKAGICAPSARCTGSSLRSAAQSAQSCWNGSTVVLGHQNHAVLLPLCGDATIGLDGCRITPRSPRR